LRTANQGSIIYIYIYIYIYIPDPLTPVLSLKKRELRNTCQDEVFLWKRVSRWVLSLKKRELHNTIKTGSFFGKQRTSQHCQDKFFLWKRENCSLVVWEPPIKGPHTQHILTGSFFEWERENQSRVVHIPDPSPHRFYHWPHSIVMLPSKWSADLILTSLCNLIDNNLHDMDVSFTRQTKNYINFLTIKHQNKAEWKMTPLLNL
jgi:hypothetical protein